MLTYEGKYVLSIDVPQDFVVITHDQDGHWMIFRKYHRMGSLEGDRSVMNSSSVPSTSTGSRLASLL